MLIQKIMISSAYKPTITDEAEFTTKKILVNGNSDILLVNLFLFGVIVLPKLVLKKKKNYNDRIFFKL